MPSFDDFHLQPATRAVLADMDIIEPTPIQVEAIPALMAGNDVLGQSATGSGKTLAYGIPLVERLARDKRVVQALVLVPTRELAIQVNAVLSQLAAGRRLTTALLVGGRAYGNQLSALRYGSQIVVGTPGRVKDHLDRGTLVLSQLRMCVLDEADQMLDSGFAPAIEEILATTPDTRQMALFSATMPDWIATLEQKFLKGAVKVEISAGTGTQSTIEQIAYRVPQDQKMAALCTLLHSTKGESSLIFGKTKYGVEKLGKQLVKLGFTVGTLHGNKSQRAREEVLTAFRRGHVQTLLATNVAARGLDITGIDQVINYELPESSDLFTHRIGRTGRMGRQGRAITLLIPSDVSKWRRMAHNLGQVVTLHQLVIDEDALVTRPLASLEDARKQEDQENGQQQRRPVGGSRSFAALRMTETAPRMTEAALRMTDGGAERPEHESDMAPGVKRRRKEHVSSEAPAQTRVRQPEVFPLLERPLSGKSRDGRREAGEQYRLGGTTRKHEARALAVTASRRGTARRKSRATPPVQGRRESASSRSGRR
ncbi:MAG: DEAD/DEAH box helicase [Ktedonobacteraceae bacterium]